MALQLTEVRKRHRRSGPWVLDGISLHVSPKQVVQIVGTNGSGKSTLVRIAASLSRPTTGTVRVAGRVTFVPEQTPGAVPLLVADYLRHQSRLQHVSRAKEQAVVEAAIECHRLGPVAHRPLRELSKGWGQRVIIAQALMAGPGVCLLDEPFTGVDAASREHLLGVIEDTARAGSAIVVTSHEAMAIHGLDRVHLHAGKMTDDRPTGRQTWRVVELRPRLPHNDAIAPRSEPSPPLPPAELSDHPAVHQIEMRPDGAVAVLIDGGSTGDDYLAGVLAVGWTIERLETRHDA